MMDTIKVKALPVYELVADAGSYVVHRNGRLLMTPAGNAYRLPLKALAEAVAQEWQAQGEKIEPSTMPMTQLVATSFDIVRKDREKIVRGLLAYTGSELLCHRAERPESLVAKQQEQWQPFLDWCEERFGARFCVGCGVMPITQSPEVDQALRQVLETYDDMQLAGISSAADAAGSLVLALALAEGQANAAEVFHASELDAKHQAVTWGDDPVTLGRQASVRKDLEACEKWFALLKT